MADDNAIFELDRNAVRHSFNAAAATYDSVAVLQREIQSRLLERVELVDFIPATMLDAGAGTARGAQELVERYPDSRVTAVDAAQRLLATNHHVGERVCGDVESLPFADGSFELVWSNLTLHWLGELARTFDELRRVTSDYGLLLFSTFGPDTLRELRTAWAEVDDHNHVNAFVDMHDLGDALVRAGFAEPVIDIEYITLTYKETDGLFRDIKQLGAHNMTAGRPRGLTTPRQLRQLEQAYEKNRANGVLPATYEVVYGTAWAPQALERIILSHQGDIPPDELRELLRRKKHSNDA